MTAHASQTVPAVRIRAIGDGEIRPDGGYVLYWMIAARRARWNFALDRAVELARVLDRPLIVLEALRSGYPRASDRLHRFVLDGMADNAAAFDGTGVLYHPYVEPEPGAGSGLLERLADDACAVVTDDYPAFFLPRMVDAAAQRLSVRLEVVDSNGLHPLGATDRVFARAFDFRRHLQRELGPHLASRPSSDPLRAPLRPRHRLPGGVTARWPRADARLLAGETELDAFPIDHSIPPVPYPGGAEEGAHVLDRFVDERLRGYDERRNRPESDGSSGLSPYLHFGHVSAHQVLDAVAAAERWSPADVSGQRNGARTGWWNMSPPAEAFLDQLVTWRELGFQRCAHSDDHDRYESLPGWARATLEEHADDPRPHTYSLEEFDRAATHDDLWNAAQNQLRIEGRIHNYLRMLWGKKILHWSESPRAALTNLVELNDTYAVDGRDPNSESGIFWVLGRYDRAWGPERPVFGKIRYMSSANTRRKLRVDGYVDRWCDWAPSHDRRLDP